MTQQGQSKILAAGGFVHCVFFWLKEADNADAKAEFLRHLQAFIDASAYVRSCHIGAMAASEREVVDSTYTYNLLVTFDSAADQDAYQTEEVHLKFIADAAHLWEKVVVYDSNSIYPK